MPRYIHPTVIETTSRGERSMDLFSRLMRDRIIFLATEIDEDVANIITAQLLVLDAENPDKDILLYINSPGGSVYDGMAIYDTMQYVRADVSTVCIGQAASMASFLLAAGAKGKRLVLPQARVMIHQSSAGVQGQARDIELFSQELKRIEKMMNQLFSGHTGQPVSKIEKDVNRDFYLSAKETVDYGICDRVVEKVVSPPLV
ncbi:MAG: ATP-dependent Clp protease proteolytic subunit [Cyanobacteria bacterium]|nr:ATP-dependent Clp protease proteolytic subunit [Cyanobacteriota bacterium]